MLSLHVKFLFSPKVVTVRVVRYRVMMLYYIPTDAVASVYIVSPPQTFNSQVPTSISLLFTALVIAQYNHTDLLDIRSYSWDFGDTSFVSSNGPTVSHTYSTPGTYTVTLIAHAPFVSWNNEDSLMLIVYEGGW